MTKRITIKGALAIGTLSTLLALPAAAHHSHASLNMDDVRTYKGRVVQYSWTMPHVFLKIDGVDDDGKVVEYVVELQHPPAMARVGWSKTTWKPGDRITWEGPHDKDPNRHYTGMRWAETGDGTRLYTGRRAAAEMVADEVTPSTDFTGLWKRSDEGGFNPHYKPPKGWPLSAKGQEIVANFDEDQNPMVTCGNPGPPKMMIVPYPMMLTRPDEKTVVIERELMKDKRVIHLDGSGEQGAPSQLGYSTGKLDGDTLIVETGNFVADRWGSHTGIDSSDQKQLVEKFWMSDDGLYLHAEITITDPVYLAKPVTFKHRWEKLADRDVIQAPCTMEAAQLYLDAGYGRKEQE
jgi:hypothetical protein